MTKHNISFQTVVHCNLECCIDESEDKYSYIQKAVDKLQKIFEKSLVKYENINIYTNTITEEIDNGDADNKTSDS